MAKAISAGNTSVDEKKPALEDLQQFSCGECASKFGLGVHVGDDEGADGSLACSGQAGPAGAYCVECDKVLCRRCIGRLHVPECKKLCRHTIEEIDVDHQFTQSITTTVMNTAIFLFLGWMFFTSELGNEYFKGANICPALGHGRWWLAHLDANIFYYFKTSLSTYCDIEDSFWRLLMDGWMRGIVTGSDNMLLLFATLPKALLFKAASVTFLMPVCVLVYAALATVLTWVIITFEASLQEVIKQIGVPAKMIKDAKATKLFGVFMVKGLIETVLGKIKTFFLTYRKEACTFLRNTFRAFALTGGLRLAVRYIGIRVSPDLWAKLAPSVKPWQLLFEPLVFLYLVSIVTVIENKLDKLFPKKKASVKTPFTIWRRRPGMQQSYVNYSEALTYSWGKVTRSFAFYRLEAEGVVRMVVDDVFNTVVFVRVVCISFGLSTYLRYAIGQLPVLKRMLERQNAWFHDATGFSRGEDDIKYLTDRLFSYSVTKVFTRGVDYAGEIGLDSIRGVDQVFELAWEFLWRLVVPAVLYFAVSRWQKLLKKQEAIFEDGWTGEKKFKTGGFKASMERYGSLWNNVPETTWSPIPSKEASTGSKVRARLSFMY